MGLRLADYVVNECGFAADLGAEDIVLHQSGIVPAAAVLVTTVRSIKNQGEGDSERGLPNLGKHIEILKGFGVPVVAAVSRFSDDSEFELNRLAAYYAERGVGSALSEGFAKGGPGAKELAEKVVATIEKNPSPAVHALYSFDESLKDKIKKVAQKIYGAGDVRFSDEAAAKLKQFSD